MLQPLGDRVLIKPLAAEEKSAGGIILPEKAQEKPREGEVIEVGPGKLSDKGERKVLTVKKGDVVVYSEYGGTEISFEGTDYLLIDEGSILAVKA
ncbi:MAG: co-chaperone GroES [Armatimonadota bacterium]